MKQFWLVFLMAVVDTCVATPVTIEEARRIGACADASKLEKICLAITDKTAAPDESPLQYRYEEKLYAAACADPKRDSPAVVAKKIRFMWGKLTPNLRCARVDFDVSNGSILKYAVRMKAFDLIDQAAKTWQVDLNVVDSSDRRTLLDYVQKEMDRNRGTSLEDVLRNYYELLRGHGARHLSELPR